VLIGKDGNFGAGYLFSTNGTLLTTFTNPSPSFDYFGSAVAPLGSDRVLIGADRAGQSGELYLFRTNGSLLSAILDPRQFGTLDGFGSAVAVGEVTVSSLARAVAA